MNLQPERYYKAFKRGKCTYLKIFSKKIPKCFGGNKKTSIFAPAIEKQTIANKNKQWRDSSAG